MGRTFNKNNLARHQVVLQAVKCIAYRIAGILRDRFRFANHCALRNFISPLTAIWFNRLNLSFCHTPHKIVVLHSESTAISLKRLRELIALMSAFPPEAAIQLNLPKTSANDPKRPTNHSSPKIVLNQQRVFDEQ